MDFFDFTDDERSVWRSDPITKAYLGLLSKNRDACADNAISALLSHDTKAAAVNAGIREGHVMALLVAEQSK